MPSRFPSNPAVARGFTLLEILVVVVIIAIMSGAIIPRIGNGMGRQQLEAAATTISSALTYCHSAAATESRRYRWVWDAQAQRARYLVEEDPLEAPGMFVPALVSQRRNEALPQEIELEGIYFPVVRKNEDEPEVEMPPEITFHPDGHATSAYVVVRLKSASAEDVAQTQQNSITIAVNGITGRIRTIPGNVTVAETSDEEAAE